MSRTDNELLIQADEVRLMRNSEGWKIMSEWIHKQIQTALEKLMIIDPTKSIEIAKIQETIRTYRNLQLKIDETIKMR